MENFDKKKILKEIETLAHAASGAGKANSEGQ